METKKLSDGLVLVGYDAVEHRELTHGDLINAVRTLETELDALRIHRDTLQSSYDNAQAVLSNILAHRDALEQRRGELLDALQKTKEGYRLMVNQRDAALDKLEQIRDLLD